MNSFTFLPHFIPDHSMEEDFKCADDEVKVTTPHEEISSSPSDSKDNQLPRYRSLADLYSVTNSIPMDD